MAPMSSLTMSFRFLMLAAIVGGAQAVVAVAAAVAPVCSYGNCSGDLGLPGCGVGGPSTLERWRTDFGAGDRLSFVKRYSCTDADECRDNGLLGKISSHLRCLVKGPSGRGSLEMSAYVDANMAGSRSEFHTKRPCGFYDIPGLHTGVAGLSVPGTAVATTTADPRRMLAERNASDDSDAEEDAENSTCSNEEQLLEFYHGRVDPKRQLDPGCPYMPLPEHEEIVRKPPSSWPEGMKWPWNYQWSYLGPVYAIEYVNGEYPGSSKYDAGEEMDEYLIKFGRNSTEVASGCDDSSWLKSKNPDASGAFYDGGVHIRSKRGSYLTRRMYQFKNDAQRDAALAAAVEDSTGQTNPGLMYAHLVAGMSGCDVEMVFEVKPKVGGGLEMRTSFPLFAFTFERQVRLRESSAVWVSGAADSAYGEALHFCVSQPALQHAQNLPCADTQPEAAFVEMGAFALTFVCQATGERVAAQMEMQMANGSWISSSALSRSQLEPTRWRDASAAGVDGPEFPVFRLALTAEQAPESCGVMFFDPLLVPPSGDGLLYSSAAAVPDPDPIADCSSCPGGCISEGVCYLKHPTTGEDVTPEMCQQATSGTWCDDVAGSSTTTASVPATTTDSAATTFTAPTAFNFGLAMVLCLVACW
mmetsp:Transcript_76725/g.193018  ORF Transcript_76725/g.193018 Transcript_76725/m.193018 type:complete len:641 (+) Transcript_76725:41-1963(+)